MLHDSKSPNKMLVWIITSLISNIKTNQSEKSILAASLIQSKPTIKYAVLTENKHLHIYQQNENGKELNSLFDNKVARFKINKEGRKKELVAYSTVGRESYRFSFADESLLWKWTRIFNKKPPSLFEFLTKMDNPIPPLVYQGINNSILSPDMLNVHSLCSPGVIDPKFYDILALSLLDISSYGQKFCPLFNTVLCSIFESPSATVDFICSDKCILKHFAPAVIRRAGQKYTKTFGEKLLNYISDEESLDVIEDPERVGVVFFSCMKYILDSLGLIPQVFKNMCSMIAQYAIIRFNSTDAVIRVICSFFSYFICEFLNEKAQNEKKESFAQITKLIKYSFEFTKLTPKFNIGNWQKRIEKNFYPRISKFALSLCEHVGDITIGIPPVDTLVCAIEKIIPIITSENKKLVGRINELSVMQESKSFTGKTNATSWSFAAGISLWFNRANENCASGDELHAPAYPALLVIGAFTQKVEERNKFISLAKKGESVKESELLKCEFNGDEKYGDIKSLICPRKIEHVQKIEIKPEEAPSVKLNEEIAPSNQISTPEEETSFSEVTDGPENVKGVNDDQFSEVSTSSQY